MKPVDTISPRTETMDSRPGFIASIMVGKPKIQKSIVNSGLLDRLNAFLPQIEQANQALMSEVDNGVNVDLEHLDSEECIEMNLDLGIFDIAEGKSDVASENKIQPPSLDVLNSYGIKVIKGHNTENELQSLVPHIAQIPPTIEEI